jgi:hypothetical protein
VTPGSWKEPAKAAAGIRVDRHDSRGPERSSETAEIENRRVHAGEADLVLGGKLLQRGS